MDPERWAVIESVYHAAAAMQPSARSSYLAAIGASDPELQKEIESLLAYADAHLTGPAGYSQDTERPESSDCGTTVTVDMTSTPAADAAPDFIGRYRVLRLLGEGGMGVVYEAEQDQPRRTVALKLIRPGFAGPEQLRRFELESQALGRLQHPGIAQIYEAGTADSGYGPQPYFAMELIRGKSLLQYAEVHGLDTGQRLDLMARICEAVQHAHQRGIIHRDLKPANILVDDSGQPKVLDFGVARAVDSDAQATQQTDLGQMLGTLAYMSPEQVLADPMELDTRSDVYALGVILYEVLAGRHPYHLSRQLHEAARTIREEEPAPLGRISRSYRGDIETIVAKALEKDKGRRYASAAGMAGDIRRYLADEPIVARPASATYQMQKFARRHKALVAGVAAVFVVLIGGIIASTWEARRARRAEQAATTESATAKAISDFLQNDLLAQASAKVQAGPGTKPDPGLKVRTALDRAAARISRRFTTQPLVEAAIRQTIGNTYKDLGLYPEAQQQLEAALELRQHVLGSKHPDTLQTMNNLAQLYHEQGKDAQAEPLLVKILDGRRQALGQAHPDTLATMNDLAVLYRHEGKYAAAEPLYVKVLELRRRALGDDHPDTLETMADLGGLYTYQGRYRESESLLRKALPVQQRVLGREHPDTLVTTNNLAVLYVDEGKYSEAEPLYSQVLEVQRRVLGKEHPDTLASMSNLAYLYQSQGRYAQADALYTEALNIKKRVLGEEHPSTIISMNDVGGLYVREGKYSQGESLFAKVFEIRRRLLGEEHPETLTGMFNLAVVYGEQGKYPKAEQLFEEALAIERRVLGEEHPDTLRSMHELALVYDNQGKYAQAESLCRRVLEVRRRVLGKAHPDTLLSMNNLAGMYVHEGQYRQAEPLYAEALEIQRRVLGKAHPSTLITMGNLAIVDFYEGNYASAESLSKEVLEMTRQKLGEEHPDTLLCMQNLGAVYVYEGKYAQAEPLYSKALEVQQRVLGRNHPNTLTSLSNLAHLYESQGKYTQAEPLCTEALDIQRRVLGEEHPNTLVSMSNLADIYVGQARYAQAEPLSIKTLEVRRRVLGESHPDTLVSMHNLAVLYVKQGKYTAAETLLREAVNIYQKTGREAWMRYSGESLLGTSLAGQKKYDQAEPFLLSGYNGLLRQQASIPASVRSPKLEQAGQRLVQLYQDWQKPEKAAEWREKAHLAASTARLQ